MSDIFISYSSKDRDRAKVLAGALEHQGWSVWWDRKIPPGRQFSQVIKEAMDEARCIIVLWSKESVKSEWVQNEAAEGARRKILVPALIDNVEIPFEFRRIQAARLVDWEGRPPHPEFDILLEALCAILGQPLLPKASEPIPDEQQPVNEIHTLSKYKPKDDGPIDTTISKEPKKLQTTKMLAAICMVTLIAIVSIGVFLKYRQRPVTPRIPEIAPDDVSGGGPIKNGLYVITSVSSKKSLDIDGLMPEDGANVIQCNYSGKPTQQWSLQYVGLENYKIMAGNSETICLEVVGNRMENNADVRLNMWQNTDNQKWELKSDENGCYKIMARHSSKYLDIYKSSKDKTANAIQNIGSDSESQKWIVQPVDSYPAILPTWDTEEEHFIIMSKRYHTCLDVKDVLTDDGTPIVHFSWWGGDNQRWRFVPVGDGYFTICAKHSGKFLTVENDNVLQQPYSRHDSQKWRVKRHEPIESNPVDFYYEIENRLSGKCLTVIGEFDVVQKDYVGVEDQKWQLQPAEQSWLNNIDVTTGFELPPGEGWKKINVDLNRDAGGDYIWLWVRGPALNNIDVTVGKGTNRNENKEKEGWKQIGPDLNRDAGGNFLYLWVRGPAQNNIDVTIGKGTNRNENKEKEGWKQIGPDLNLNAGGNFLYLWVR